MGEEHRLTRPTEAVDQRSTLPTTSGADGDVHSDGSGHGHRVGHGHGHDHGHGVAAAVRAGARHKKRLALVFALMAVFFVVELVAAFATNSLALLSDAGHMFTDLVGLGMALAAIHVADRARERADRTFGLYRLEILAALANAVLLFAVGLYVLWEGVQRLRDPVEIATGPMLVVAVLGGLANVVGFLLLRRGAQESLNVRGAYLEVLADLLGSVGVILAGVVIVLTGWHAADAIIGAGIGLFIFPRTWRLGAQAVRVLVQAAPPEIDVAQMRRQLAAIDGVVDVHDLHVWTLTSEMEVATAHLMIGTGTDAHGVLDQARQLLLTDYGIDHATLQVEPETHTGCEELSW